jgi:hypothetical protein
MTRMRTQKWGRSKGSNMVLRIQPRTGTGSRTRQNTTESPLTYRFARLALIPRWTVTPHRATSPQVPGAAR